MKQVAEDLPDRGGFGTFEKIVFDLHRRLLLELENLDQALEDEAATTQQRLKIYSGFFKMVQGVELMINGIKQQRERENEKQVEVVEFRRQLEEQIAKLIDEEAAIPFLGRTER